MNAQGRSAGSYVMTSRSEVTMQGVQYFVPQKGMKLMATDVLTMQRFCSSDGRAID